MNRKYVLLLSILFFIIGCQHYVTVKPNSEEIIIHECKPIVKYSDTYFSIKGIEIPIGKSPIKIGEVTWDPKLLQQAHVVTQILDMHRMTTCEKLPTYASLGKEELKKYLDEMSNDEDRLFQLALLVASGNQEGVKKWVEVYSSRAYAVATPQLLNEVAKLTPAVKPQNIKAQLEGLKTNKYIATTGVVPLKSLMQ